MTFKERYKYDPKKDLLGRGGFSEIYKAHDVVLDRIVALKFFRADTDERYGILAEIRRVVNFRHPNLVQYYDLLSYEMPDFHGSTQSVNVGVMEYVNHGDLYEFIKSKPAENVLKQVIIEILEGLQFIHDNKVIHRDLKPQNILMHFQNGRWTPKICDFGISKSVDSLSSASSELLGTVEYMAPEQFNSSRYGIGGKISTNVDLWAFGVILYELFSGEPYFGKRSREVSTQQIMNNVLKDQGRIKLNQISEPYRSVINLCLVQSANQRIKNASDLISVLAGEIPASPYASSFGNTEKTSPLSTPRPVARVTEQPVRQQPLPPATINKPPVQQIPPKREFQPVSKPVPPVRKQELKQEPDLAWQKDEEPPVKKPTPIKKTKKESRFSPIVFIVSFLFVAGIGLFFWLNYPDYFGKPQNKVTAAGMPEIDNSAADDNDFMSAKTSRALEKVKNYLVNYPQGLHKKEALELFDDVSFETAKNLNTAEALRNYLLEFPGGKSANEANRRIMEMESKLALRDEQVVQVPREETSELSQSTLEVEKVQKTPVDKKDVALEDSAPEKDEPNFPKVFYDSRNNKFDYEGEVKNGVPDGNGKARYTSRDIYEGMFVNGKRHGYGTYTFAANKHTFTGEWEQDNRKNGKFSWFPGDEWYNGEWENNKPNGIGIYHYSNGSEYKGQMVNELKQGKGIFNLSNGDSYEGEFYNDKYHGKGVYYNSEGKYDGNYVNGKKEGYGEFRWKDGSVYKGEWLRGFRHGRGTMTYKDETIQDGQWENDNFLQ